MSLALTAEQVVNNCFDGSERRCGPLHYAASRNMNGSHMACEETDVDVRSNQP